MPVRIENILEYSLEIRFSNHSIEVYDMISKRIVNSAKLDEEIKKIKKIAYNSFLINDRYSLGIGLVHESCKIITNAQYILELSMDNENHGFYFGTYEIGEFVLKNDNKIEILKSFPLKYCSRGILRTSKQFYISLREGDDPYRPNGYYLTKIDWQDLSFSWKKSINSPVLAMRINKDKLFLGLREGNLQIWNFENNKCEKEIKVFESPISDLEVLNDRIILTSYSGDLKLIDISGISLWELKLSDYRISGLLLEEEKVKVIDEIGHFFEINVKNGEILNELSWNFGKHIGASTYSNLISLRNWYISFGGAGLWTHWSRDHNISYHIFMQDPLIRKVVPHPLGFITGDDDGCIRFWKIGSISIFDLEKLRENEKINFLKLKLTRKRRIIKEKARAALNERKKLFRKRKRLKKRYFNDLLTLIDTKEYEKAIKECEEVINRLIKSKEYKLAVISLAILALILLKEEKLYEINKILEDTEKKVSSLNKSMSETFAFTLINYIIDMQKVKEDVKFKDSLLFMENLPLFEEEVNLLSDYLGKGYEGIKKKTMKIGYGTYIFK